MNTFTHLFEQLEIMPGYDITANGEVDVTYRVAPADPSVGIVKPYVTDVEITAIVVDAVVGSPLNLDQTHPVYKLIHEALIDSDELLQACANDAQEF